MIEHFGIRLNETQLGLRLTRDSYVTPSRKIKNRLPHRDLEAWGMLPPPDGQCVLGPAACEAYELDADGWHRQVTEETYNACKDEALINYDLNMAFYATLDREDFRQTIDRLLLKHPKLTPIDDLTRFDGRTGLYVMVLDDYCQAYVGQSDDITKRIRRHWTRRMPIDRLIFGTVDTSRLPIDAFRALDTTRIYVWRTTVPDRYEDAVLRDIPDMYRCNRIPGGLADADTLRVLPGLASPLFLGAKSRRL